MNSTNFQEERRMQTLSNSPNLLDSMLLGVGVKWYNPVHHHGISWNSKMSVSVGRRLMWGWVLYDQTSLPNTNLQCRNQLTLTKISQCNITPNQSSHQCNLYYNFTHLLPPLILFHFNSLYPNWWHRQQFFIWQFQSSAIFMAYFSYVFSKLQGGGLCNLLFMACSVLLVGILVSIFSF